jgi:hypothetical protein
LDCIEIWVMTRGDSPGCRWKAEHLLSLPGFAFVTWLRLAAVLDECRALMETGAIARYRPTANEPIKQVAMCR